MNDSQKNIIDAVIHNNLRRARWAAEAALKSDKTKKDEWYCANRLQQLKESSVLTLPVELEGMLSMEAVDGDFHEERYFLTDRERACAEAIFRYHKVAEDLAERDIHYCNSTLLHGASGTGKTTFARYVAYKLGLPFVYLNLSRVIDSYLGKTQKNIASVFDYVASIDCVFVVDEVDAIGLRRGNQNEVGEMNRITIALMQALDTLPNHVVLIAATNRLDKLDEALVRRFARIHEVKPLDETQRRRFIENYLAAIDLTLTEEQLDYLNTQNVVPARLVIAMVGMLADQIVEKAGGRLGGEAEGVTRWLTEQ